MRIAAVAVVLLSLVGAAPDTAAAYAQTAAPAPPANARDAYNLACVHALAGKKGEAVAALGRAADLGFAYTSTMLEPAPLIVALHGTGGTAEGFAPLWRRVASDLGAVLAVPQGINPAGRGFDWGVVEQGSHLVLRAIERARAEAEIDESRIVVAGFSNGASQAFIQALLEPDRFAGVLSVSGFYDERVAPVRSGRRLPRFAILNGERDEEAGNNRRAARALRAAGGKVKLEIYPGLGHSFPPDQERELRSALEFLLRS